MPQLGDREGTVGIQWVGAREAAKHHDTGQRQPHTTRGPGPRSRVLRSGPRPPAAKPAGPPARAAGTAYPWFTPRIADNPVLGALADTPAGHGNDVVDVGLLLVFRVDAARVADHLLRRHDPAAVGERAWNGRFQGNRLREPQSEHARQVTLPNPASFLPWRPVPTCPQPCSSSGGASSTRDHPEGPTGQFTGSCVLSPQSEVGQRGRGAVGRGQWPRQPRRGPHLMGPLA